MIRETWIDRVSSLTHSLLPLPTNLKHDHLITFCLKKRSELTNFITQITNEKEEKSVELAREFIKNGDNEFQSYFFEESLALYSKSILYAPNNSQDLSEAYVRRSLVLLLLGYLEDAARDVEMALQNGFSRKKSLENLIRLLHIGEYKKARTVLYEVLTELNVSFKEQNVSEIDYKIKGSKSNWNVPKLKNGENPDFPSSSNCVQVLYSNEKGRYVVAKCDIQMGDVLFVEKAFAITVANSHCTDCGIQTVAPIPCLGCVDINFCSKKCRDSAWELYHKFECGFINLIAETGIGYLALRIILKAASNFEELTTTIQRFISKNEVQKNNPVKFSSDTFENIYNLQTCIDSMDVEDILQYSLTASLLALYLVHHTSYAAVSEKNIKVLGQVLLQLITQLICNAHTISAEKFIAHNEIPSIGFEQEKYGGGIYPSISMMNHSCEPSIFYCAYKDILIVRAKKDIKKGEEVFNSYGVDSKQMERLKRQELLKSAYFFDCRCSACSQKYDPYDVLNSLKCEKCKGPVVSDSARNDNDKKLFLCLNCDSYQDFREEQFRRISEIRKLIEDGKQKLQNDVDVEGALKDFIKSWKLGRTVLYKLHVDLYYSASLIAHCLYLMNDLKPCIAFLKCVVLCAEERYGHFDWIHGYLAKKLVRCLFSYYSTIAKGGSKDNANEIKSMLELGLHYQIIVENISNLNYGEGNPSVSIIEGEKEVLQNMATYIGAIPPLPRSSNGKRMKRKKKTDESQHRYIISDFTAQVSSPEQSHNHSIHC